jgi:hypothetical protein
MGGSDETGDIEIIDGILDGRTEDFEILLDRYRGYVFKIVSGLVPFEMVQDLAHEVFIEIYRSLSKFDVRTSFKKWLAAIATHMYAGHRILLKEAVDTMETVQTLGKPMAYMPPGAKPGMQYALGNWCERWRADGQCTLVSGPKAFGTFPWIDRLSGLYGIFFLRDRFPRVEEHLVRARAAVMGNGDYSVSPPLE